MFAAWRRHRREWLAFIVFVFPNLALFLLFTYWPILKSVQLSLTDARLFGTVGNFVGLQNYRALLSGGEFWRVAGNTALYAALVVVAAQILGFALALMLNRPMPGRTVFRTMSFLPHVTTPAAAALVWILILDPALGPFAPLYDWLGIQPRPWVAAPGLALLAVAVVGMWKETAFSSIFFLAGLQGLPADCFEAARLESESRWRVLRHITIPLMTPVIFFVFVSGLIAAAKVFELVLIMTRGGPVYPSSSTFVYHLYHLAFQNFQTGMASAFAILFLMGMVVLTWVQFRVSRRWVHYGE